MKLFTSALKNVLLINSFIQNSNFVLNLNLSIMNTEETTEEVISVLGDCINQIAYLHDKFTATGSGNNVLNRAHTLLGKLERTTGLGIAAGNPGGIEADSPAGTATPKESVISVEALEKEGWEKDPRDHGSFSKGKVGITFWLPGNDDNYLVGCLSEQGYLSTYAKGVSSMQDLRQLEQLVNGKQ